jgi:hypothetical protein
MELHNGKDNNVEQGGTLSYGIDQAEAYPGAELTYCYCRLVLLLKTYVATAGACVQARAQARSPGERR